MLIIIQNNKGDLLNLEKVGGTFTSLRSQMENHQYFVYFVKQGKKYILQQPSKTKKETTINTSWIAYRMTGTKVSILSQKGAFCIKFDDNLQKEYHMIYVTGTGKTDRFDYSNYRTNISRRCTFSFFLH
jgi:hypothetical protein